MGSAAAAARFLNFGPKKARHALAIAASFAGAPMGNAGTKTKPLHVGKAARFGMEAALMADHGMEGNAEILDIASGYGAFYDDYKPEELLMKYGSDKEYVLHKQDVAIKRFPAHLGMHFGIDAILDMRDAVCENGQQVNPDEIFNILIVAPKSKYINRPLPTSAHEARHSFQFNVCSALLDGSVTPESFEAQMRNRLQLKNLLQKTEIVTTDDNSANFETMYIEVLITMVDGTCFRGHCDTPYGHWRHPLLQEDLEAKFRKNTTMLSEDVVNNIIKEVQELDKPKPASVILNLIQL